MDDLTADVAQDRRARRQGFRESAMLCAAGAAFTLGLSDRAIAAVLCGQTRSWRR